MSKTVLVVRPKFLYLAGRNKYTYLLDIKVLIVSYRVTETETETRRQKD